MSFYLVIFCSEPRSLVNATLLVRVLSPKRFYRVRHFNISHHYSESESEMSEYRRAGTIISTHFPLLRIALLNEVKAASSTSACTTRI